MRSLLSTDATAMDIVPLLGKHIERLTADVIEHELQVSGSCEPWRTSANDYVRAMDARWHACQVRRPFSRWVSSAARRFAVTTLTPVVVVLAALVIVKAILRHDRGRALV